MAYTVKNIIDDVRPLVADDSTGDTPRWSDPQIMTRINLGIQETFSLRPDSVTLQVVDAPDELTSVYDEVPLRTAFRMALTYYAAWSLLSERSSDKSLRTQGLDFRKLYNSLVII